MEAALKKIVQESLGEFVKGGLENVDGSFPMTLRNLKLNEKAVQKEIDEVAGFGPVELSDGTIGSITLKPGWMGTCEVVATDVVLNLSFSPARAMKGAMQGEGQDDEEQHAGGPVMMGPPPVPPRYCRNHDTSEKRTKVQPQMRECRSCHMIFQTNYSEVVLCPPCSEGEQRCMICGSSAPTAGSHCPPPVVPANFAQPPAARTAGPPPRGWGQSAPQAPRAPGRRGAGAPAPRASAGGQTKALNNLGYTGDDNMPGFLKFFSSFLWPATCNNDTRVSGGSFTLQGHRGARRGGA